MKRVYWAYITLDTSRPGGVWWCRDMPDDEVPLFIEVMRHVCTALRLSDQFPVHDPMHITPPDDAVVIV